MCVSVAWDRAALSDCGSDVVGKVRGEVGGQEGGVGVDATRCGAEGSC